MKLERYELRAGINLFTFEFVSDGKCKIIKIVEFEPMSLPNLYNLSFADKNTKTGELDDLAITDNGDAEKVLATVVAAVYDFTETHPEAWIHATGSTKARTRLYRMGINKYFDVVQKDFVIMGKHQNDWELYQKGKDYQAFAVHRKNH
jgi:hypothetical protein